MVGNDVVDLGDAETRTDRTTHPRFDARVFCAAEHELLASPAERNRRRWTLWSAKEAAYKLGVKRTPGLVFSPRRFRVELDADGGGRVRFPGGEAQVRVTVHRDAVHAVATSPEAGRVIAETAPAERSSDPSHAVRELARCGVARALGLPVEALELTRRDRVPWLHRLDTGQGLSLSLSHHGRYVAYACALGGADA